MSSPTVKVRVIEFDALLPICSARTEGLPATAVMVGTWLKPHRSLISAFMSAVSRSKLVGIATLDMTATRPATFSGLFTFRFLAAIPSI
jgi:hypothetical protein